MPANTTDIEKRLWDAADELRANSKLKSSEYSVPVLGLIFLRHADQKFTAAEAEIGSQGSGRRKVGKADYQALGVLYLPEKARFSSLLRLTEGENIGKAINDAMEAIETENPDLKGVLPHTYTAISNRVLSELLKLMSSIPDDIEGDAFGRIYEYFLGEFAMSEGQKGGEFFTPLAIVKLIVEVIEPYHGRIYDPACGSGGMFVQSAEFVRRHKGKPGSDLSVFGHERVEETVKLSKMNLAVHGLAGDIRQANSYYEDLHKSPGQFDFVMANPPFNVNRVDKDRIKDDKGRFPFGMPTTDNANYLWIQLFYSSLNAKGRSGFVMANSAADARGSELEIRKQLIESSAVDVMISVGSNFFYTVTLPCTLWFLDRGKAPDRKDTVLFIDARHIYRQIDRAHRDFTPEHIEFISNIVRLYRGEKVETEAGSEAMLAEKFSDGKYADVAGLCAVKTLGDIEGQGWSLNPGRHVGVADRPPDEFDFYERLEKLNEELEQLNAEARNLEERISKNVSALLEGPTS